MRILQNSGEYRGSIVRKLRDAKESGTYLGRVITKPNTAWGLISDNAVLRTVRV